MKKAMIGYQVYSAREEAAKDLKGVLKKLAELGYDGVEFAGFYGHGADEVKAMLEETGLKAISGHQALPETIDEMFAQIAFYKKIGCEFLAVPYLDEAHRPGSDGFGKTIGDIYRFGRLCREAGIQLLYHNHDFEFVKISGEYGLDFLYHAVPEDILKTELDVCWVKYAGEDPAAFVRKYTGRAPIVHLKDYVGKKGEKSPYALISKDGSGKDDGAAADPNDIAFEFRPVGYGCQDVPSVVEAGLAAGAGWFIVEQDQWYDRHPLEAAKMSIDYLRSIGL
ncbi:MAG: sugar phosphate isomerase/epimerase [Clostridia bacterium]|nr:sugar phosphate isomerase/epimerase [Clostridia bacterium]